MIQRCLFCVIIFVMSVSTWAQIPPPPGAVGRAQDTRMREFIMSCTYGVLAGTLVGAAMLAFTDQPGENLNKVARGASLGLYAGIALGIYVVYVVPGQLESQEQDLLGLPPPEGAQLPKFNLFPVIGQSGIEGVAGTYQVLSF